jgi:sugar/nucleoside kinase (ribokinase family)
MQFDVFGMCNPLFDIQAEIPDALLDELPVQKGGMFLIDEEQQQALISKIYAHIVNAEAGGSGANTMIGVAQLGGTACYTGKFGDDEHGTLYAEGLRSKQVHIGAKPGAGTTGISVILVTPDTQRTMCTFLGICRELHPDDVPLDALRASKYLYVTGYLWDTDTQKAAVLHAMREAKAAGVKIAFSLSDPFCVHRHKADFLQIIQEHVDLLFGNTEEAQALTDTNSPREAIQALAPYCELAAITSGAHGSLLREGDRLIEIPAYSIHPVDSTGAGDMYAAGLLYGLTHDLPLEKTGRLASYVAAQVVAKLGPRLEELDKEAIAQIA